MKKKIFSLNYVFFFSIYHVRRRVTYSKVSFFLLCRKQNPRSFVLSFSQFFIVSFTVPGRQKKRARQPGIVFLLLSFQPVSQLLRSRPHDERGGSSSGNSDGFSPPSGHVYLSAERTFFPEVFFFLLSCCLQPAIEKCKNGQHGKLNSSLVFRKIQNCIFYYLNRLRSYYVGLLTDYI